MQASPPGGGPATEAEGAAPAVAIQDVPAEDPSTEELFRDAENAFGEIFSVRAPRDVFAGLWSGASCVLSGLFLGVAGLVTQPFEGFREAGIPGCFRGAAIGLASGLFFGLTGLCTGVFQAVRGVIATPKALCMAKQGWRWDAAEGRWFEPEAYSLPAEAARVMGEGQDADEECADGAPSGKATPPSGRKRVADMFYYDALGVTPGASQQDIRRAYFQQSRQWHPDKTSEAGAKEKFQAISEAYQVLSDPARRRAYDSRGKEGAGEGFVDAQVFFNVLLGADALEPYIGHLRIAEMFDDIFGGAQGGDDADLSAEVRQRAQDGELAKARQVRRQVALAVRLAQRLDSAVDGASEQAMRAEARGLLQKDSSAGRFIVEIGWLYRNRAEWFLAQMDSHLGGYGVRAIGLKFSSRTREAQQQATTAKLAVRSIMQLRRIATEAEASAEAGRSPDGGPSSTANAGDGAAAGPGAQEEELPAALNDALPTFMEAFWSLASHDITSTLDKVVERVLSDESVGAEVRRRRAEALRDLGAAFVVEAEAATRPAQRGSAASGAEDEDEAKRRRFEEAFVASMGGPGGRQGE